MTDKAFLNLALASVWISGLIVGAFGVSLLFMADKMNAFTETVGVTEIYTSRLDAQLRAHEPALRELGIEIPDLAEIRQEVRKQMENGER